MIHIVVFLYILAFSCGLSSVFTAFLVYSRYRNAVVIYGLYFLASLSMFCLNLLILNYSKAVGAGGSAVVHWAEVVSGGIGGILFVRWAPWFFSLLLGRTPGKTFRTIIHALLAATVLAAFLHLIFPERVIFVYILNLIMIAIIGHALFTAVFSMKELGDPVVKRGVRFFFIASAIYFPFHIIDTSMLDIPVFTWDLSLPLYFIVITAGASVFVTSNFNSPGYIQEEGITWYFTERFSITAREKEIVENLLGGKSNSEIAKMLFISLKTVENHLYSVYRKTGVKNRLQLFNLIRSHESIANHSN